MEKLVILDSNALIHRAYHALPQLKTSKGEVVNAVYGFASILLKAAKDLKPDYLAAVFDLAGPTWREKRYQEYKAKRVKADQELYDQIPLIKKMLNLFKVPIYQKKGYEADDLIGSIVAQFDQDKSEIEKIIITGDLDILQLINQQTKVYLLKTGISQAVVYGRQMVEQKYGFTPGQVVDFKALRGDPSDNIPGVPGIGEKTALGLLKQFGNLKNLYQKIGLADLNPKLKARLLEYKEQAFLSYDLAKIKTDLKLGFKLRQAKWGSYDEKELAGFFEKLEFDSLIKRLSML